MRPVNLRVYPQKKLDLRAARKSTTSPLPVNSLIELLATLKSRARKKRSSNRQNPIPPKRTSVDQNSAQTAKTLFRLIQCIHHFDIANNQLNGAESKIFEGKLTELNRFVKPACLTASLAQDIELMIHSMWLQDVTESLVSRFRERLDAFKLQLSTFQLNVSVSEKAQNLAEKWARQNFRSKLKDATLVDFRSTCKDWLRYPTVITAHGWTGLTLYEGNGCWLLCIWMKYGCN